VVYPTLVGHRGVGNPWTIELGIPEESIPAIQWAAQHHANVVEGDASVTSDGKMVMMHDETIDRTTNRRGKVRECTLAYITGARLEIPVDRNNNEDFDDTPYHPTVHQAVADCGQGDREAGVRRAERRRLEQDPGSALRKPAQRVGDGLSGHHGWE
jgi:glycerophosphoryl diester phosphodiesterase